MKKKPKEIGKPQKTRKQKTDKQNTKGILNTKKSHKSN